jgi:arsenate reductase
VTQSVEGFIRYNYDMKSYNILFLCTGNSARSILAEALVTTLSGGKFIGYSAGSNPAGLVNPFASELVIEMGYPKEKLRSKNWDEYSLPGSPQMDFIITVCDNAANEVCPIWLGHPSTAHWGFPDPASVEGTDAIKREAFQKTLLGLTKNIEALIHLPIDQLDLLSLKKAIQDIHDE